jgi:hypothetical protein
VAPSIEVFDVTDKRSRVHVACRVVIDSAVLFDSEWLSIRFANRRAAEILASLAVSALGAGVYRRPPGHTAGGLEPETTLQWKGDLNDDCAARVDDLLAHAEWMNGPRSSAAAMEGARRG